MLNSVIQKVANLINDDVEPELRRVYEDIIADLGHARDVLGVGGFQIDAEQAELPLWDVSEFAASEIPMPLSQPVPPMGEAVQEFQPQPGAKTP